MEKNRLEAFSDGVLAIIITILVLEMRPPHGTDFQALTKLIPIFGAYVLSFIYVGIYWNNHHHMLHTVKKVHGPVMWANLHLLFWLSLIPFTTGWMGENHFETTPTFLYGLVLLMAAAAYWLLQRTIIRDQGPQSLLKKAIGRDLKGKLSPVLYASALGLVFVEEWIAQLIYVIVALIWLIPDSRIEKTLES